MRPITPLVCGFIAGSLFLSAAAESVIAEGKTFSFGFPNSQSPPDPSAITSNLIQGVEVMATISPDGRTLAGMGVDSGKWTSVKLRNDSGKAVILASTGLVVCKDDESIHVLDSKGKRWKSIKLEGESAGSQPILGNHYATIQVNDRIYAYAVGASAWSVLKLPASTTSLPMPQISKNYILVSSPHYIYTYTSAADGWAGIRRKPETEGAIETVNVVDSE